MPYSKSLQMDLMLDFLIGPTVEESMSMGLPFAHDESGAMIDELDIAAFASRMPSVRDGDTGWWCLPAKDIVERGCAAREQAFDSIAPGLGGGVGPFTPDEVSTMARGLATRYLKRLRRYGAGRAVDFCEFPGGRYGFRWR